MTDLEVHLAKEVERLFEEVKKLRSDGGLKMIRYEVCPKTIKGEANYTIKVQAALVRYLDDGVLKLLDDNNNIVCMFPPGEWLYVKAIQ